MKLKILAFVEDYLEFMSGKVYLSSTSLVRLARYDTNILNSLANQTMQGTALTDRQAELAITMISKYHRQLLKLGIDTAHHITNPVYRLPLRVVNRNKTVELINNRIIVKFPFSPSVVDQISTYSKNSPGKVEFNKTARHWEIAITEPNMQWVEDFANESSFEISDDFNALMEEINKCDQSDYAIRLQNRNGSLSIDNAPASLVDYINTSLGGFEIDNLLTLVDHAAVIGYTTEQSLINAVTSNVKVVDDLLLGREINITTVTGDEILDIFKYAELVNRWPVYVFDAIPGSSGTLEKLNTLFSPEQFKVITSKETFQPLSPDIKCVYLTQWNLQWEIKIPLLIATSTMMWGAKKRHIVQCSTKVVYYSKIVYNQD